ncbi:MAG: indole-3-glycerol phosphate synthase TrpC [Scytonematopsis contorta HA4267-MV1]|jgi:indole-3-glycerol phosphate synthase|nr:indole-3-glycerol phosphate synthase TrpC [Scytonematopsis contorta HA4267-MV1]
MKMSVAAKSHILDKIVLHKKQEIAQMQKKLPLKILQQELKNTPPLRNFLSALCQSPNFPSLIAEVKKASPSRGVIRDDFDPVMIAQAYERGGASCISVLTDKKFFKGSFNNLLAVRMHVKLPLLCKEFIIDPYQIYLARVAGADAVLLIAAILTNEELYTFHQLIQQLGMTALVEVHTEEELYRVLQLDELELVGINNRNLEDFTVDIRTTLRLLTENREILRSFGITVVSESGFYTADDLSVVAEAGVRSVLVGESLVKQNDIEQAVQSLIPTPTIITT